jgi:hypothetical protein
MVDDSSLFDSGRVERLCGLLVLLLCGGRHEVGMRSG